MNIQEGYISRWNPNTAPHPHPKVGTPSPEHPLSIRAPPTCPFREGLDSQRPSSSKVLPDFPARGTCGDWAPRSGSTDCAALCASPGSAGRLLGGGHLTVQPLSAQAASSPAPHRCHPEEAFTTKLCPGICSREPSLRPAGQLLLAHGLIFKIFLWCSYF